MARLLLIVVSICAGACGSVAGSGADKRAYTLFHPTPREQMRPMSTDRPDTTESPHTVDAGHLQVELSLIDYAYDADEGVRTETLSVVPSNVKVGLTNDVDLQLVFTPYVRERAASGGHDEVVDGFGDDTTLRLKVGIWGNDEPAPGLGPTALAVMPFIKFPTGSGGVGNDHVEGGVVVPFAADLPGDTGFGTMLEVDAVYDEVGGGYGVELLHTVEVGHDVPGLARLGAFVEYVGVSRHGVAGAYQAAVKGGFVYALSEDWVLDWGGTAGITEAADDASAFVGMSFRF